MFQYSGYIEWDEPLTRYNWFDEKELWEKVKEIDHALHDKRQAGLQKGIEVGAYEKKEQSEG